MYTTQNIVLNINLIEVLPTGWNGEKDFTLRGAKAYLNDLEINYDLDYHEDQFTVKGGHYVDDQVIYKNQSTSLFNIKAIDEDSISLPLSEEEKLLISNEIKSKLDIK